MKKEEQGDFSPIAKNLQPGELPQFVQVGDRQVPIFPMSVLLELAKLVERIRVRQGDAAGNTELKDSSRSASIHNRPKRNRSAMSGDPNEAAAGNSLTPEPTTRRKVVRRPRRRGGEH